MAINEYVELFDHVGHLTECVTGDKRAIKCITCDEVLSDDESHTTEQVDLMWKYYSGVSPAPYWSELKALFPVKTKRVCVKCGVPATKEIVAYLQGNTYKCVDCVAEERKAQKEASS